MSAMTPVKITSATMYGTRVLVERYADDRKRKTAYLFSYFPYGHQLQLDSATEFSRTSPRTTKWRYSRTLWAKDMPETRRRRVPVDAEILDAGLSVFRRELKIEGMTDA